MELILATLQKKISLHVILAFPTQNKQQPVFFYFRSNCFLSLSLFFLSLDFCVTSSISLSVSLCLCIFCSVFLTTSICVYLHCGLSQSLFLCFCFSFLTSAESLCSFFPEGFDNCFNSEQLVYVSDDSFS